jgi:Tfp pilus assembly protein PilN
MPDIDFLPAEYRQKHARRRVQPWRVVVVAAFVGLVACAALAQRRQHLSAQSELAAVLPLYDASVSENSRLGVLQTQLLTARGDAELCAYLRHPWPVTQLLSAVVRDLPKEITLSQLHVGREVRLNQPGTEPPPPVEKKDDKDKKLPRAQRDLNRLREECDKSQTVMRIAGTAGHSGALHRYLAALGGNDLFTKAELRSVESAGPKQDTALKFQIVLLVQPGYGQPGGPTNKQQEAMRSPRSSDLSDRSDPSDLSDQRQRTAPEPRTLKPEP